MSQRISDEACSTVSAPDQTQAPGQYQLVETRLQQRLDNGSTQCNLCLWRCKLKHGQRGFCEAHVNRHGTLYNLSYGIISSIELGPIEEKPVLHFRPGSKVLSIGSYGCNFRCGGCHNLEISWGTEALDALARGESRAAYVTPEQMVQVAVDAGADGIAFTYSEPAVWLEYVLDVSKLARDAGLYTVYVTNSFVTDEALEVMAPWMDVLCSDIKSLSDAFYRDICPVASVDQVLESIRKASELGIHVETRTNVIPGKNDSEAELERIAHWIRENLGADSPWHITRFFPAFHLSHLSPTDDHVLEAAGRIGRDAGLNRVHVFTDKGCDCAQENRPVSDWLALDAGSVHEVKKCAASCCGDEGILLKRYEDEATVSEANEGKPGSCCG
ncbi:MAG: AmmeMemoRadiSam system radical SAM enzyme [Gammaproteobacteria bacterium]